MKNLRERIMAANFGKLLKRWIIAALCVVLLCGGVSAALLAPQIRETITAVQTAHQQKDRWEHDFPHDGHDREEEHMDRFEVEDVLHASVTRPSTAAVVSMGVTALLCGLLALAFWLLVAAWLYQAAVLSDMSGPLWGVLGLMGNVFAAVLFVIVRSFLRRKCPVCGRWQNREAAYCSACGGAMGRKCPDCGAGCAADARFCSACGVKLEIAGAKGGEKC